MKLTAVLILGSLTAYQDPRSRSADRPEIAHVSFSKLDQWGECVRRLTGKSLLLADFQPSTNLPCPLSQDELGKQIEGKAVLVLGDKWDLLIGKGSPAAVTRPESWKGVSVNLSIKPWEPGKGSRRPSDSELAELSIEALRVVRSSLGVEPPVAKRVEAGRPVDAIARINLELLFDIHRTSPTGPESVIGILREQDGGIGDGRIIYGELRNGKPSFLWDSPRLTTRLLDLSYRDLNHDGVEEILLMSFLPSRGTIGDLVIFTTTGQ
jgi:hypothetical protein